MINRKQELAHSLERFVIAQKPCYEQVVEELHHEQKRSHWMWFIFPQIKGLGHSEYAQYYGIYDLDEAKAYLSHPVLGLRYEECLQLLETAKSDAEQILGDIDAKKLKSSLTLFLAAEPESPLIASLLEKFFLGKKDPDTTNLIRAV